MGRSFKLKTPPDPATVTVEIHGDDTLRVPDPNRKHLNLTCSGKGRPRDSKPRGWTPDTKKRMRLRISDHKAEFKTFLHLKFPSGSGSDPDVLKDTQDKVFRWVRDHLNCHYIRKVEFAPVTTSLHWHAALDATLDADQQRDLSAYVRKFGLVATVTTPDPATIARYLGKSDQTTNPPWFAAAAFRPWHCTFPKPDPKTVTLSAAAAASAGVIHPIYSLNFGGAAKLAELAPASMSLTAHISADPLLSLTRHIPDSADLIQTAVAAVPTVTITTSGSPEFGDVLEFEGADRPERDTSTAAAADRPPEETLSVLAPGLACKQRCTPGCDVCYAVG